MKRCPVCHLILDDDNLFCPVDSSLLEPAAAQEAVAPPDPPAAPAPADPPGAAAPAPRHVDTGALVDAALGALEGRRSSEREAALSRMHQLKRYDVCCHAAWRFVHDLAAQSPHFSFSIRNADEDARMWVTSTLTIGEGKYLRRFPIRVTYDRELGHDVTLEIDLEDIGLTRDERIERTEEVGGRAMSTRFGWSYVLRAPREIEDEEQILDWLRQAFWKVFRRAYGVEEGRG
jgi:hypothetical protein